MQIVFSDDFSIFSNVFDWFPKFFSRVKGIPRDGSLSVILPVTHIFISRQIVVFFLFFSQGFYDNFVE